MIGKKGKKFVKCYFKGQYLKYIANVFNSSLSMVSSPKIVEEILKLDFDKCVFLFNYFVNINEQKVYVFDILSLAKLQQNLNLNIISEIFDFFVLIVIYKKYLSGIKIFADIYNFIIFLMLLYCLLDYKMSELSGKIISMGKSSQNMLKMFNSL